MTATEPQTFPAPDLGAESQIVAAIDVGTESTGMLIAAWTADGLHELDRRAAVPHLGDGLYATGELSRASVQRVLAVLDEFLAAIAEHDCTRCAAVLTSAVREAANRAEFVAELRSRYGLEARIVDGAQEAELTYRGVTLGRAVPCGTLVVDVGGGSCEFVVGAGRHIVFSTSTEAGVARKTERFFELDPVGAQALAALEAHIRATIEQSVPEQVRRQTVLGIAAAAVSSWWRAIPTLDEGTEHRILRREVIESAVQKLHRMRQPEIRAIPGLDPSRARSVLAGAVVLQETMRAFGLDSLSLSRRDLLDGVALSLVEKAVPA